MSRIHNLLQGSYVKYDQNRFSCYLNENGVIVLGNEYIELPARFLRGPYHAMGHFLEAPDKYINKPYFGFRVDWPESTWCPRELDAIVNHILLMEWDGEELSPREKEAWFARVLVKGREQEMLDYAHSYAGGRTIEWCLEEWHRKNQLLYRNL